MLGPVIAGRCGHGPFPPDRAVSGQQLRPWPGPPRCSSALCVRRHRSGMKAMGVRFHVPPASVRPSVRLSASSAVTPVSARVSDGACPSWLLRSLQTPVFPKPLLSAPAPPPGSCSWRVERPRGHVRADEQHMPFVPAFSALPGERPRQLRAAPGGCVSSAHTGAVTGGVGSWGCWLPRLVPATRL